MREPANSDSWGSSPLVPPAVFLLALVFILPVSWWTPYDFYEYMVRAMSLATGQGYANLDTQTLTDRPPLYSLIIAGLYLLFGKGMTSIMWLQGIAGALNITLLFILGRALFGAGAALMAVAWALSGGMLHIFLANHIDPFLSLGVMAFLLATLMACERDSRFLFCVAGLILGASFLVKEAALVMAPFPMLAALLFQRGGARARIVNMSITYAAAASIALPWVVYVALMADGGAMAALGAYGGRVAGEGKELLPPGPFEKIAGLGAGFFRIWFDTSYMGTIASGFSLTPLFVAGWIYAAVRAVKGDAPSRYLVAALVCLAPLIAVVGQGRLRMGQLNVPIMLSTLALAASVVHLLGKIKKPKKTVALIGALVCAAGIAVESNGPGFGYMRAHTRALLTYGFTENVLRPETGGLASYLIARTGPGDVVMAADYRTGKTLFWELEGARRITLMPDDTFDYYNIVVRRRDPALAASGTPAALSGSMIKGKRVIFVAREKSLLDRARDCKYLIVNHPWESLRDYLDAHEGFILETVIEPDSTHPYFSRPFYVYRIDRKKLRSAPGWRAATPENVMALLAPLKAKDPGAYRWYRKLLEEITRAGAP